MIKKIICILFLFPASLLFAEKFTSGELVYFEGEISLQRNNSIISEDDIVIGTRIEEYDLLSTGDDGYAEITVVSAVSDMTIIKVEANSNLYFKIEKESKKNNFNLKILSGNLFMKVNKLIGNGSMNISARSAVMGIRGTELYLTSSPDGSLLVTCPEGSVLCKSGGGEALAGNGSAAEILYSQPIKLKALSNELIDNYRSEWAAERERIFNSMSFSIIKPSAIQYEELLDSFETAYKDLEKHKKIFRKYLNEKKSVSTSEVFKDKIVVSPSIINMRSIFYRFEQQFYRIEELHRYNKLDPVKGKIRKKYSISDFMKDYDKNYSKNVKKLVFARSAFKSFSAMQTAEFGIDSLMDEVFSVNPLLD